MKLVPILLRGNFTKDLMYNFGAIFPVTKGEWQLSIQTVAFEYMKSSDRRPDPPPINEFLYLSSNYVEETQILSNEESSIKPVVLSLIHINLKPGEKKVIQFAVRDFFNISSPTKKLFLFLRDEHYEPFKNNIAEKLNVTIMLLLRRVK